MSTTTLAADDRIGLNALACHAVAELSPSVWEEAQMAQPGGRPTMMDVAADAGVSLQTVSRVVNQVATVDPALTKKVFESIRKLGFRRNDVAASLRSGTETKTIGLITADLANAFYSTLSSAIAAVLREREVHVIIPSSEQDVEVERSTALDLCQRRVSGLIKAEVDLGIPVDFVDRPGIGLSSDAILVDNRGGAVAAAEQLVSAGHRRIGVLLDSLDIFTMRERLAGLTAAVSWLFERIDGDNSEPRRELLPTWLVIRGGSWPAASR
ncbi:LacI family DNA-binding transcriptional regulator [uncultured Schumannella sp.]|uniref:LacI family DNA-binding transcriptional regulator n=1 Tax=uncultured Schumannella sp. TaxID=1195956 RepID=UPI0025EC6E68|nr:LacI family DNA-binding transcriptional regulator [uncultured Schumannella sp.]